ncbi:MAG: hypothetical protein R2911_30220 [Caldilineaceae bacterium]
MAQRISVGRQFCVYHWQRYKPQAGDVFNTWQHIPLFTYATLADFLAASL